MDKSHNIHFQKIGKVNDRNYKIIKNKKKSFYNYNIYRKKKANDFYTEDKLNELIEDDEISSSELGFMRGYINA